MFQYIFGHGARNCAKNLLTRKSPCSKNFVWMIPYLLPLSQIILIKLLRTITWVICIIINCTCCNYTVCNNQLQS